MKESQFGASRGYSWFMDIIPIPEQVAKQTMEWNGMDWGTLDFNFLMIWTVHATLNM